MEQAEICISRNLNQIIVFISSGGGGFLKSNITGNNPHVNTFYKTLRSYEPIKPTKKYDYLNLTRSFVKKEFVPVLAETARKQRIQSARLSKPKYL
jgi:hypothetical protein